MSDGDAVRLITPLVPLYAHEGMYVVLAAVQVTGAQTTITLACLRDEMTHRVESNYWAIIEAWDGRPDETIPAQPADVIFTADIELRDDAGTHYQLCQAARGGSGRMFQADWHFRPGVPRGEAITVTVRRRDSGHPGDTVQVSPWA